MQRAVVHGRVDEVKTEYSHDHVPLDSQLAELLEQWRASTPYPLQCHDLANPMFLLSNVVMGSSATDYFTCCTIGYHGATGLPIQTYLVGDFDSSTFFVEPIDVLYWSHEVAEWMNDPFVNNPVPAWGHVGQQPGCQTNLEVGDPLSGTQFPAVTMNNGFTYHPQELAFFSWFFGAPSVGVNGWFSDNGTFLTDAGPVCQ